MNRVAIIGSTGLEAGDFVHGAETREIDTPAGTCRLEVGEGELGEIVFLQRSNGRPGVPPHAVNFRANVLALRRLEVDAVFATSVVGSLTTEIPAETLVVVDQFLDFTKARPFTLFDEGGFAFVDVTDPYCPRLREPLVGVAYQLGVAVRPNGCYVAVEGPRYETRAEIEMYRRLGGDVIGMTNVPEVVMAREAGLCYAALAFVSNLGAGLNETRVSQIDNQEATVRASETLAAILRAAIAAVPRDKTCSCASAVDLFFSAEPEVASRR